MRLSSCGFHQGSYTITGEQALGEPQLLQPLAAARFVAIVVRFADAVEGYAEPLGKDLAELRLAGPRRAAQEDVDARFGLFEGASQQSLYMIATLGDMFEVRPFQLARGRRIQQQATCVEAGTAGDGGQAPQPVDDRHFAIAVDRNEPRAHQRSAVGKPVADGAGRNAEQGRDYRPLEGPGGKPLEQGGSEKNLVDHRLDDRLRLVSQQQFQNSDVRSIETGRFCHPSRRGLVAVRLGRA